MTFDEVLKEFGHVLGKLKRAYAEDILGDPCHIQIIVTEDNFVTMSPSNEIGNHIECFRDWVDVN